MLIGLILLAFFLILAALMYLGRLPALLALPLLALGVTAVGGVGWRDVLGVVVSDGAARLGPAMVAVILGAVLAQLVDRTGIARVLVTRAAELGGDRPLPLALLLTGVVALLFTTLGGLGAVIMVATIVFPILLSIGLAPWVVGCLFLLGLSLGGIFNVANWQVYLSILGLSTQTVLSFAAPLGGILAVATVAFAVVNARRPARRFWAAPAEAPAKEAVRWPALLTPLVPLVPVLYFGVRNYLVPAAKRYDFPLIAALLLGIAYGLLTTWRRDRSAVQLLSRSVLEGISSVGPALALLVGIGMVVTAMAGPAGATDWKVSTLIRPLLLSVTPHSPWTYVLLFGALAPLALYRGPLNLYGMGAGLVAAMLGTGALPPAAIMAAFFSVGLLQGVSDPTNTHNVWIANNLGVDVGRLLKATLPYVWAGAVAGLVVAAAVFMR